MKKILIVSHERSGTHFLANSIAFNFQGYDYHVISVEEKDPSLILNELLAIKEAPRIFKSHHEYFYLKNILDEIAKEFYVFYVVRDGRDVLTSCYYHYSDWFFTDYNNFQEFLWRERPVYPKRLKKFYIQKDYDNIVLKWKSHVENWIGKKYVHTIRYEDLKNDFYKTINKISKIIIKKPNEIICKPTVNDFGVKNRKGIIGDYKNHFTEDDNRKFCTLCHETMEKLGYDININQYRKVENGT